MATRLSVFCLLACSLVVDRVEACAVAGSQSGVLFDHIPEAIDAPVIVEVTIISRESDIRAPDNSSWAVMDSRVERVIRGTLNSNALKVVTYLGTCTAIGIGHGFVAGTLEHDRQLGPKLIAVQRPYVILRQQR